MNEGRQIVVREGWGKSNNYLQVIKYFWWNRPLFLFGWNLKKERERERESMLKQVHERCHGKSKLESAVSILNKKVTFQGGGVDLYCSSSSMPHLRLCGCRTGGPIVNGSLRSRGDVICSGLPNPSLFTGIWVGAQLGDFVLTALASVQAGCEWQPLWAAGLSGKTCHSPRMASVAALLLYKSRVSGSDGDGGVTSTLRKLLCGVEMGRPLEQLDGVKFRDTKGWRDSSVSDSKLSYQINANPVSRLPSN